MKLWEYPSGKLTGQFYCFEGYEWSYYFKVNSEIMQRGKERRKYLEFMLICNIAGKFKKANVKCIYK